MQALSATRSRSFRLLWLGQSVSLIGTQATTVALAWRTFTLTGSPTWLGVILTVQTAAMLGTTLIAGAVADRSDRKAVLLLADVVRGLVMLALAGADASGLLSVEVLVGAALVLSLNYVSAYGLLPVGLLVAGAAVAYVPAGTIIAVGASATAALFVVLVSRNFVWTLDEHL